ncbi:hypothetical protein D5086_002430 [Populus alba]|uniref:Uncharacterized protein n=1 Tax=Populus alba TaxID=43335 RepID=A0ACC4D2T7_POPAL
MLEIVLVLVALFVIYYTHLLIKWKYPKINGVPVHLPPGSMGLPVIGETMQLLIPSYNSIDIHPFIRKRIQREKMLPQIDASVNDNLRQWSTQGAVEVKSAISRDKDKMSNMVRHIIKERLINSPDERPGDFLDQALNDMASEKFLTEDFIAELSFGILFAAFESVSTTLTLAIKFLAENPLVLEELTAENEAVLKKRENPDSQLTWEEYKTMAFTQSVVNETLRLMNIPPGLLRKALKDINVKGYTIPAGWTIMLVTPIVHLNPETYKDPLKFNPWRWKDLDQVTLSKSFMPFGGGTRQCAGAEFSKVYMAAFLHVLVTKYRWSKVKGGRITRSPILLFPDGVHIKITSKRD